MNGSFVEDTTQHAQREPNDIDVVTFFQLPDGRTQVQMLHDYPVLLNPESNRRAYGVDAYTVVLSTDDLPYIVKRSAYWNSLWSHDRNQQWKGYLQIDLSADEDGTARAALDETANVEVGT